MNDCGMKRINHIILATAIVAVISACGGNGNLGSKGKKFAPKERESSLSEAERADAIAAKRAEDKISLDTLLYSHSVRLGVMQPKVEGDISENVSERFGMKFLQIASQNGISGLGTPNIVLGAEIAQTDRTATGTAPQKMMVKYELTFKVMNTISGDVYATAQQHITGVGNSFEEASLNAVKEVKNTPQMQKMLQTASERIISWYNSNVQVVKNQVERAAAEGNYAYALSLVESVPEQATAAFSWASGKHPELLKGMLHKQAADLLAQMEGALASSGDEFNPAVGAYISLIPADSPEHKTAQSLYAQYEQKCHARRAALEAKAERDEQAARDLEKYKMMHEHEKELAEIEADKIKAKYKAQASSAAAQPHRSNNVFNALGHFINGASDRIFNTADVLGNAFAGEFGFDKYRNKE